VRRICDVLYIASVGRLCCRLLFLCCKCVHNILLLLFFRGLWEKTWAGICCFFLRLPNLYAFYASNSNKIRLFAYLSTYLVLSPHSTLVQTGEMKLVHLFIAALPLLLIEAMNRNTRNTEYECLVCARTYRYTDGVICSKDLNHGYCESCAEAWGETLIQRG